MLTAILPRAEFRAAVSAAKVIVERRNNIPILGNAAITADEDGSAMLRATDMDIMATIRMPGATADAGFGVTIPLHMLHDLEKKAPATDCVAIDGYAAGDSAALDFEGLRVTMQALPVADFPELAVEGDIHADFEVDSADLLAGIEAVSFAMSTDETRYYLNGIFLCRIDHFRLGTRLRFVATDGHRLAFHDIPAPEGSEGLTGVIIPSKTVGFLEKLLAGKERPAKTRVLVNTVKARFLIGNVDVLTKLVDGTYPDYGRVVPAGNDARLSVDRKALQRAIKAVTAVSSELSRAVRLSIAGHQVTVSVINPDVGIAQMTVAADWEPGSFGDFIDIGFNARYLDAVLDQVDTPRVVVKLAQAGSPTIFVPDRDTGTTFVLMPMRV